MGTNDERNVDPIHEMTQLAENFLNLARWNFKESFRSDTVGDLIYDSGLCRVNLVWGGWDPTGGNTISIYYGRLHASSEKTTMIWNGEECHCWHRIEHALHFIDGRTPADAAKLNFSHSIKGPFNEEEFRQKFRRRQPEWLVRMHATIWEHYSERLFELFDLRRPDLWAQYRQFLKEFYDIKGRSSAIKPSLDTVC
jgi:hypothetical protein